MTFVLDQTGGRGYCVVMKRLLLILMLALPLYAEGAPELLLQVGHTDPVSHLAWGPKGLLLTGSKDGTAKVWDTDNKHLLATLTPAREKPMLYWVGWLSPNEVVTGTDRGDFWVYDWKTGALVRTFKVENAFHVGGNGPLVAGSLGDGSGNSLGVAVYSAATGQLQRKITFSNPNDSAGELTISPDGKLLAVEVYNGRTSVRRVDVITLADGKARSFPSEGLDVLAFSPDGHQLATAYWGNVNIYDLASGKSRKIKLETSAKSLSWPTADRLVVAYNNSDHPSWNSYNAATGAKTGQGSKEDWAESMAGTTAMLARSANGIIDLEDYRGQKLGTLGGRTRRPSALLADGSRLLVGLDVGTYLAFDLKDGTLGARLPVQNAHVSGDARLSPNRQLLASCDSYNGVLHIANAATGADVATLTVENSRNVGPHTCCFSPDGKFLAVPGRGQIVVYDTSDWKNPWAKIPGGADDLAWFGTTLTAVRGRSAIDYDTATWKPIRDLTAVGLDGRRLDFTTAAYLPGGDLWLGTRYSTVAVMRPGSTEPVLLPTSSTSAIYGMTASADGSLVVTTGDWGVIDLWDARSRKLLPVKVETHGVDHYWPTLLPDGRTLAAIGGDYRVRFWDLTNGQEKGQLVIMDEGKNWVAAASDGHFDGTPDGQRTLEWKVGAERYRLDQFFEQFFKPGLLHDLAAGSTPRGASVAAQPKPPMLEVVSPAPGTEVKGSTTPVVVKITERGNGASRLKLYANGHPVAEGQRQGDQVTFQAPLSSGVNELRVTAYDASGKVESRGDWVKVTCQAADQRKPQLHVLACGIDKYSERPLKFARADAEAFVKPFGAKGLFEAVKPTLLLDEEATRPALLAALGALANVTQPQDTVVIYLSGHGTTEGETYQYRCVDNGLLTSPELAQALEKIPASRQLLVLDTCHSGAASGDLAARFIRGQQRLARGSGTFLLAASRSDEAAAEVPGVRHGLLTFAVLRATEGAPLNPARQLTANGLVQYASYDVEELARKYSAEQEVVQYSTGRDFPLLQK